MNVDANFKTYPNSLKIFHTQILNAKLFKIIEENREENLHVLGFGHVDHELRVLTHNTRKGEGKEKENFKIKKK